MSAYTKAPWAVGVKSMYGTFHANMVYEAEGSSVALIYGMPQNTNVEDIDVARWGEGLANARLIAAAPELLECLVVAERFYSRMFACGFITSDHVERDRIRAAIAKATQP